MKLKTLALATLFISAIKIKSQTNYDFNSYKYRVKIYQYKSVNLNSTSNNNLQGAVDKTNGNAGWEKNYTNTSTQNSLSGGYNFYRFVNSEEKQRVINTGVNLQLSHSSGRYKNNSTFSNYNVYSSAFSSAYLNLTGRNYKGNKFNYFEVNSSVIAWGVNDINSGLASNNTDKIDASYAVNLKYGFGKGRLELISDPIFAAFWLEDMKNKGIVSNYSATDVEALAKTITQIRNTRIIDFRFRTIDQIKMYDAFFIAQGLITKTDAAYYSTLYDHYLYANNFTRYSGKRNTWYCLGNSNQYYSEGNNTQPGKYQYSNSNSFYLQAGIGFKQENEKALSMHMQKINRSILEFFYDYSYINSKNNVTDTSFHQYKTNSKMNNLVLHASKFFGHGHYFNTRSYLEYGTELGIFAAKYLTENIAVSPQVKFNLDYFYWFSPNLQLTLRSYLNSNNQIDFYDRTSSIKLRTRGDLQPGFSLSLNYTIF